MKTRVVGLIYGSFLFFIPFFICSCDLKNPRDTERNSPIIEDQDSVGQKLAEVQDPLIPLNKVNYYVDASGSMFGYFNGSNGFKTAIASFLHYPQFAEINVPQSYCFVCDKNIYCKDQIQFENAFSSQASIMNLIRNSALWQNSKLNAAIDSIVSHTKQDEISIFFTDAIYSLAGVTSSNLTSKLEEAGEKTKAMFIRKLTQNNFQCLILQFSSNFDGNYYTAAGASKRINQERPFYVMIFGSSQLLNNYFRDVDINRIKGYRNSARYFPANSVKDINFKFKQNRISFQIGEDRRDKPENNKTIKLGPFSGKDGDKFNFYVLVDFSHLPFDESFYTNPSNYMCGNDYQVLSVKKIEDPNYNYKLTVEQHASSPTYTSFDISLRNDNQDFWIGETDTQDDNTPDNISTLGFANLLEGIKGAYEYKNNNDHTLAKIPVVIVK